MFRFLKKDKLRDQAREMLRHARHFRHMREDVLSAAQLAELNRHVRSVEEALQSGATLAASYAGLHAWLDRHIPRRPFPGLRENLEILVVAVGVAMACRTYFIQPFKIPTGSMQPTLFGIQHEPCAGATLLDHLPFKLVKWAVTGEWYQEIRTRAAGYVGDRVGYEDAANGKVTFFIGTQAYRVPIQSAPSLRPGEYLPKGTVLWRGVHVAGDHVFVDRIRWNLWKPRRGQIMVFNTDGIPTLPAQTHYIKRMTGLPGEVISINPPDLIVNGQPMRTPEPIARIERREPGYAGYKLVESATDGQPGTWALRSTSDKIQLSETQYFALGDNTQNSRDGRYWGAVPRQNLVGPAVFVYWPFSRRWGLAH